LSGNVVICFAAICNEFLQVDPTAKDGGPTIDRIEIVESESQDALLAPLKRKAPVS
jgi:hypothetical protein